MRGVVISGVLAAFVLSGCNSTLPSEQDWTEANRFLAQNAWGGSTSGSSSSSAAPGKRVVRNEQHEAVAGVPLEVGIRWALNKDCSPAPFTVRIVQPPRFGRAYVQPVNFMLPQRSIDGRGAETMRRCAGRMSEGQAVYYEAPPGKGNYYDRFSIETSKGLRFNYKILVHKPVG